MIKNFLQKIGFKEAQHVLIHSSFKQIKSLLGDISIIDFVDGLKSTVTESGSILMPTFTYCFKKKNESYEVFSNEKSASKVGAVTEVFRNSKDVIRTSSPTHSFALWGKVTEFIDSSNNPQSPLGKESPMDWFANHPNSFLAMLGTDFQSFTLGHYLEVAAAVPWSDISPWDHLGVEKMGASINGETRLKEVPGCSKSFVNFEKYLLNNKFITLNKINNFNYYFFPVKSILDVSINYFKNNYTELLCKKYTCKACDERREKLKYKLENLNEENS